MRTFWLLSRQLKLPSIPCDNNRLFLHSWASRIKIKAKAKALGIMVEESSDFMLKFLNSSFPGSSKVEEHVWPEAETALAFSMHIPRR